MASFVLLGALVMTVGAALTLWSDRQLWTLPLDELRTHPAWTRSRVGLGITGAGALLISVLNLLDSTASTSGRVLGVVLAATGVLVVAKSRLVPTVPCPDSEGRRLSYALTTACEDTRT